MAIAWPERCGDYRIEALLGSGSSGDVFRARREGSGEPVAIKALRVDQATHPQGFEREIHALQRLRHSGIVRIIDHGIEVTRPWFAMELLEPVTLRTVLAGRYALHHCLEKIRDVCNGLAYVHGEGIVHRDVKPENVHIRRDGQAVLCDFGLAARNPYQGVSETLESGGRIVGTLAYAPPEQLRGEYVDARADLYALGCMLFEAAAGSPPFTGTPAEVYQAHLHAAPPRLRETNPEVPAAIDELVALLLEKSPRDRIGYAVDVRDVIEQVIGQPALTAVPEVRLYLYRPRFIGREPAVRSLEQALADARHGQGGCVLIEGESGSGKTRLAMEFSRRAGGAETQVITSECVTGEGSARAAGAPLHAWRPVLRAIAAYCASASDEKIAAIIGDRADVLAQYEPALRPYRRGRATPLDGQAARDRMLEYVVATLRAFVEDRTLLYMIDDLQWADELSLVLLHRVIRGLARESRLLIVTTCRSEEIDGPLERLREEIPTRIELGELGGREVDSIVADMLGAREVPPLLSDYVSRQAEGNPFFISEYLYAAAEEGVLNRVPPGRWDVAEDDPHRFDSRALSAPISIQSLARRRIDRAPPAARSLAQAAAVLGREFDLASAREVAALDREAAPEAFRELSVRQIVSIVGEERARFNHDKLRETAYASLDARRRTELHRRAARSLESRFGDSDEAASSYADLAGHWLAAGVRDKARDYLALAGEHAYGQGAYRAAYEQIESALAEDGACATRFPAARRARLLRLIGSAAFALGDLGGCIERTGEALAALDVRVPDSGIGWLAWTLRQATGIATSRLPGPFRPEASSAAETSIAATQLAASYYYEAKLIPSTATAILGLNAAEHSMDDFRKADAYSRIGYILGVAQLARLADRCFEKSAAYAALADDPRSDGLRLYMEAMYRIGIGHWQTVQTMGAESGELFLSVGDTQESEVGRTIGAHGLFYAGRIDAAHHVYETILVSASQRSNIQHEAWGMFLCARSMMADGRDAEALPMFAAALDMLRGIPDMVGLSMCEGLAAHCAARCRDEPFSRACATVLLERLSSGARPAVGQCLDAYGSLAEAWLHLWRDSSSDNDGRQARRAIWELWWFSRIFPIARPAYLRCRGLFLEMTGKRHKALAALDAAVGESARRSMPVERLRSLKTLESICPPERADEVRRQIGLAAEVID